MSRATSARVATRVRLAAAPRSSPARGTWARRRDARPRAAAETPCPPAVHAYDPTIGVASIAWDPWSTALDPALPWDQSGDDARSLTFTSAPLAAPLELVGQPVGRPRRDGLDGAALAWSPSSPTWRRTAARRWSPSGGSTSAATAGPAPCRPGRRGYRVTVPLRATAYRLAAGHRLRLAVACADFPRIWPTPAPAELRVHPGSLARRPAGGPGGARRSGAGLGTAPGRSAAESRRSRARRSAGRRGTTSWPTSSPSKGPGRSGVQLDPLTRLHGRHRYTAAVASRRPDLARMESTTEIRLERPVAATELVVTTVTTRPRVSVTATITARRQALLDPDLEPRSRLTARNLEAPHEQCDAMRGRSSPLRLAFLVGLVLALVAGADRCRAWAQAPRRRAACSGSASSASRPRSTRTGPPRTSSRCSPTTSTRASTRLDQTYQPIPMLAEGMPAVSAGRAHLHLQAPPGHQVPQRQGDDLRGRGGLAQALGRASRRTARRSWPRWRTSGPPTSTPWSCSSRRSRASCSSRWPSPNNFAAIYPKEIAEKFPPPRQGHRVRRHRPLQARRVEAGPAHPDGALRRLQGPRREPPNGYGGRKIAYVDEIRWIPMPDVATRVAPGWRRASSTSPTTSRPTPTTGSRRTRSSSRSIVRPYYWPMAVFNKKEGLMTNQKLRQAWQAAIDIEPIMKARGRQPAEFYRMDPGLCLPGAERPGTPSRGAPSTTSTTRTRPSSSCRRPATRASRSAS